MELLKGNTLLSKQEVQGQTTNKLFSSLFSPPLLLIYKVNTIYHIYMQKSSLEG